MKKITTLILCKFFFQSASLKSWLLTFIAIVSLTYGYAANISSTGTGGDWNATGSWVGGVVPAAGDNVTIVSGANVTITTAIAQTGTITVNSGGTLTLNAGLTSNGSTITINGTLVCGTNIIDGSSNFTLASSNNASLQTGNADGISGSAALGSIQNTGSRSFGQNATYIYNGAVNQVTGDGLPATIGALTINNTGTSPNNVVSLTTSPLTIKANPPTGALTLTQGIFQIGTGNTLNFNNNSSSNSLINNGGNLATTNNGQDGGTVVILNGSGANFNITGTGTTTFYNFSFGTAVGAGNRNVVQNTANSVVINGTLTIQDNQSRWSTNSPIYGPNATLYVNNNGQGYTPGSGSRLEWMAIAPGAGTIGTTPGYPNNVTIVNVGTSVNNGAGFSPNGGSWSINGTLSIGDGTVNCVADVVRMSSFSCGGITINNNSKLGGTSFSVNGNWLQTGAIQGVYANVGSGTITFGGSGTSVSPQTITASTTLTTFNNIAIGNGTNSTYVKLNTGVTLSTGASLTLASGIVETTPLDILNLSNTSASAITGGNASYYINGPLEWSLAATTINNYLFPVGAGSIYLPLTLSPNSSNTNTATVQAFNTGSGGTPDHVTINYLDSAEYWSLTTTSSFTGGANISVTTPTAITPYNMLAQSATVNGIYSTIGGTVGTNGVTNAGSIAANSPDFFALGNGPLTLKTGSITYPTCSGTTGSVTVQASGGTAPYQYAIGNGVFSNNNIFTALTEGTYIFSVEDNAGTIAFDTVQLSPITITKDTTICTSTNLQLSATNNANSNALYSWTSNPAGFTSSVANPTVSPAVTTTYTVTSLVVNSATNLITNPGFESGDGTGFTSGYFDATGNAGLPYTAAANVVGSNNHNGIYAITTASTNLCVFFTPTFNDHTSGSGNMMVIDGPSNGSSSGTAMWSETVPVAANTNYVFTYWLRNADLTSPLASVETKINNADVPAVTGFNTADPFKVLTAGWTQVSYLWNSGSATSAAISLYDLSDGDVGNDFAIDDLSMYITCQDSASVTVTVSTSSVAPTVTSPVNYCQNETATALTATGTNLLWYTAATDGTGSSTAPIPSTTAAGSITYYVSQTGTGSCGGESPRASITVNVTAAPSAPTVTTPVNYCQNATASALTATGTSLLWYATATGGIGSNLVPVPSTATVGSTTYYVSQSNGSCESPRASITVNVTAAPSAPTVTSPVNYCQNVTATALTATGTSLLWYTTAIGGTGSSTAPIPSTATVGSTTYYVSQSNAGCESPLTPIIVNIASLPVVTVSADQTNINSGTTVTLTGSSSIPGSYMWTASPVAPITDSTDLTTTTQPKQPTLYTLNVLTTDNNCSGSDTVTVFVNNLPCTIQPSRAFTPNGDGVNDKWFITRGDCVEKIEVNVYNRFGGLVFHSDDYNNDWDGKYKGVNTVPDGTYYYVILVTFLNNQVHTLTGNVTIIR